jgi:organic radical activating enzyme
MFRLTHIEFNITNVCNLGCVNCSTFNNFYFKGHQRWADYKYIYEEWGEIITFPRCSIIGGEPTLNPDIINWINGIHRIWPSTQIEIFTNGEYLNFFDTIAEQLSPEVLSMVDIHISVHNIETHNKVTHHDFIKDNIANIATYYKDNTLWLSIYDSIKDATWPPCNRPSDFNNLPTHIKEECITLHHFSDEIFNNRHLYTTILLKNNVTVTVSPKYIHSSNALITLDNTMTLHNSNPSKAHALCHLSHCHQFKNGNLYQCPLPAVLPEFITQHTVQLTNKMETIISDYTPLGCDSNYNTMRAFIDSIGDPHPYCNFCPTDSQISQITSTNKKNNAR